MGEMGVMGLMGIMEEMKGSMYYCKYPLFEKNSSRGYIILINIIGLFTYLIGLGALCFTLKRSNPSP